VRLWQTLLALYSLCQLLHSRLGQLYTDAPALSSERGFTIQVCTISIAMPLAVLLLLASSRAEGTSFTDPEGLTSLYVTGHLFLPFLVS
jgi:hypothetical protein